MGLNFISSAQHEVDEARLLTGIDTGAGWDRLAIYWSEVEQKANTYNWELYDEAVNNDVIYGLRTDAILLGTPQIYYQGGGVPAGLYEPVFSDRTDTSGSGKNINPDNPWAEFIYAAVSRYKPGGKLAGVNKWPTGRGVRVWEIWNEPDFALFWQGSAEDYARMLKVAYIAAQHADPQAKVMIGGLVLWQKPDFVPRLLETYKHDPNPVEGRYPFDIVAVHSYSHPWNSFYVLQYVENLLAVYGLNVPVWLNESGVTVWDDYPGPEWATRPDQIIWRASQYEQASYVIQNAAYAFMAEADVVFHFQLYDDCGNQPPGSTFAPHDGSLCDTGAICWGDALGLMRNSRDNVCFNQHPNPNTPRPAYDAFRTVAKVFGKGDFVPLQAYTDRPDQEWLFFARPASSELIIVMWNKSGQQIEAIVPASSTEATLLSQSGNRATIQPGEDEAYHITLLPATNKNQVGAPPPSEYMIGGPPVILIEQYSQPVVSVLPLLDYSNSVFFIKWRSSDLSLESYQVWYRDDTSGGDWVLWFETGAPGDALFVGERGRKYSFFARGMKADGQWTADEPKVQAWTIIVN